MPASGKVELTYSDGAEQVSFPGNAGAIGSFLIAEGAVEDCH
jgi:hypothetical protein